MANREEIIAAAAKVFQTKGYHAATVQDIADAVGILKGSLYHYIKMKEDLLFWLLEAVHGDVEVILEDVKTKQEIGTIPNDYIFALIGGERPNRFLESIGIEIR